MKNIILCLGLAAATTACSNDLVTSPNKPVEPISLGTPSQNMVINDVPTNITPGPYAINVSVTQGAAYSFQLTHIDGQILHNYGFIATSPTMNIELNYSNIPVGAYDLILIDNVGKVLKTAVIIQR